MYTNASLNANINSRCAVIIGFQKARFPLGNFYLMKLKGSKNYNYNSNGRLCEGVRKEEILQWGTNTVALAVKETSNLIWSEKGIEYVREEQTRSDKKVHENVRG